MEEHSCQEVRALSCHGLRSEYSAIDRDLWAWYCRARNTGGARRVSKSVLQRHAKLAFSRAGICNFKASDGWYRRWITRWQKRDPAAVTPPPGDATEPNSQSQVVDRMKILHDVASQQLSAEISRSKDGGSDVHPTEDQDAAVQPRFSGATQESTVAKRDGQSCSLPDSASATKKPASSDCFMNELFKHSCSGRSSFVMPDRSFLDFSASPASKESCPSNPQLESSERRKQLKRSSELCCEDENLRNLNDHSLDIMDYLTLHITESCENSQFGNGSNCMSHSNTIDHILSSTTSDSVGSFLCYSMLGEQQAAPAGDLGLCSEHLNMDHLREFAGLVSQFSSSSVNGPDAPRLTSPSPSRPAAQDEGRAMLPTSIQDSGNSQLAARSVALPDATLNMVRVPPSEVSRTGVAAGEVVKQEKANSHPVAPSATRDTTRKKRKKKKKLSDKQHKKGERYLPKFKEKVLAYAATRTFKETARKFNVNNATISAWKKDKTMMNSDAPGGQRLADKEGACRAESRRVDTQFLAWLRQRRDASHEVTREEVQQKAEQLATQLAAQHDGEPDASRRSRWFLMWAERMKKQRHSEDELELWVLSDKEKEQHIQYPAAFKMEVAEFADRCSQIRASKTFSVSRKRVFEWLKAFRKKRDAPESKAELEVNPWSSCGRAAADVEVDRQIWEWYKAQAKKPSGHEVRQKGLELYRARGHTHIKCSYGWYRRWSERFQATSRYAGDELLLEWVLARLEQGHTVSHADLQVRALALLADSRSVPFKASPGWAIRFCKRYPELLYHYPTVESKLPPLLVEKVDEFRSRVRAAVRETGAKLSAVGSMDEFRVNLSALLPVTAESGTRRQLLRRPELGNCHVTVVLACLADGALLPPMVIAKGNLDSEPDEQGVLVTYHENAHMDEKGMKFWLEHVWFKNVASRSVLVMDCYEVHSLPSVQDACTSRGTRCLVIPGGCASKLQPLDVAVRRSFQDAIEMQWAVLGSQSSRSSLEGGGSKLQLPAHQKVIEWVDAAYKHVRGTMQETIRRSFLVTGLTVAANHSEDHFIDNLSMVPAGNDQF